MPFTERDESAGRTPEWVALIWRWLKGLVLHDWGLKLLALFITLGLWWGVTGQRNASKFHLDLIQVSYRVPANMEISNEPRRAVEVTLSGAERLIERINSRDLVAYVDLSDFQPGDHLVSLTPDRVSMGLPSGVRIDDIQPNSIKITLEASTDTNIPVRVRVEGGVAEGYEVRGVTATPDKIRIRGPESRVKLLQSAPTEAISVAGRTNSFTVPQAAIDLPDQKVNPLDAVVIVTVEIAEKRIEKSFSGVTVTAPAGGISRPQLATVTLFGPRSLLESLDASGMKLELTTGNDGKITLHLALAQGNNDQIELRSTRPAAFSISK